MLIEINRVYVGSGFTNKQLINTDYIKKIEPLAFNHTHAEIAKTLVVMDGNRGEENLLYITDTYLGIKTKITKQMKIGK